MNRDVVGADPDALRDLLPRVSALGDQVAEILVGLSTGLEAEGACWGRDEAGAAFAASYLPASTTTQSLIARAAAGIQDTTPVLSAVLAVLIAGERDAARAVRGGP